MDDGDSHPASANLNRKNNQDRKHNLPCFSPAGYAFLCFFGWFHPRN
ncbi:unknown [Clostridium sp. CAG:1013]|nr:unknown [Clostridium sp. CAG:1013]